MRRERCPVCGSPVLIAGENVALGRPALAAGESVLVAGGSVVLEIREWQDPLSGPGMDRGRLGRARPGPTLPGYWAVSESGACRMLPAGGVRRPGEAVHAAHDCAQSGVVSVERLARVDVVSEGT